MFENSGQVVARTMAMPVALALLPLVAGARTVVVGTGNHLVDLPAVQAAADAGGSVLLAGTFDFGDGGRVIVRRDVDIGGESDESGAPLTTIRGGEWSFHTPYPDLMPPPVAGPVVSIHDLHFVGSRGSAIHLAYSGGCSLRHNVVDHMRPRRTGAVFERAAIVVGPTILGGTLDGVPINGRFIRRLVSGDVVIADNLLHVGNDPSATNPPESTTTMRGTGMFVAMYVGADVRIERNLVTENTRTGLAILDGTFDDAGRGSLVIAGNTVKSSVRVGFTQGAGPRAPIGIVTGFNNQRAIGADPNAAMIPALITDNTIELDGVTSMGIVNIWNGAVITDNAITVHADLASSRDRLSTSGGILATTSHQVLMNNRIAGEGCNAIRIGGTTDGQERFDDVAIANHIEGFDAFARGFEKCADYWLEPASHDSTVVGHSGRAIDEGVGNKVTGARAVAGGVGSTVSAAVETARAAEDTPFGFE